MNTVVFRSNHQEWETPQRFFDALNEEFGFTLDSCATAENAKCERFLTLNDDALSQSWDGVVFCNPPYGYRIGKWVRKAFEESLRGATVVGLIPAKTETAWWHDYVMRAAEIRLIRGRLRFSGSLINAPFPSAIVIWEPGNHRKPRFTTMDRILDEVES